MAAVKVSSKYQVVLPVDVRERHGFKPGDNVAWIEDEHGLHLVRVPTFRELRGILTGKTTVPFVRDKEYE
ncbi:MAG: AbrB/MazE/SpoVT family DNA-binding domain-containing protein [Thermoleophilia bacterium]|nr:AbrB/MazE/SpoVT family DNA-binding domain-containing protein [Thermoleophilia bacterium]